MVGARGLVPVRHGGALAQEQRPVVAEMLVIPGVIMVRVRVKMSLMLPVVLQGLDLQVLRGVPVAQPGRLLPGLHHYDLT